MFKAILIFVVLMGLIAGLIYKEEKNWQQFKVDHECKLVGHISASTGVGLSSSGKLVTTYEPSKNGWLCNDGITYYR